jgi:hypothetical protein
MGQAQVKGAPSVYKMIFRAGGSRLAGSLSHEDPVGQGLAKNALQPVSDAGNSGLNEKPVLSVDQQVFDSVELRHDDGKSGRRGLVRY